MKSQNTFRLDLMLLETYVKNEINRLEFIHKNELVSRWLESCYPLKYGLYPLEDKTWDTC